MVGENITDTALMNAEEMLLAGSAERSRNPDLLK